MTRQLENTLRMGLAEFLAPPGGSRTEIDPKLVDNRADYDKLIEVVESVKRKAAGQFPGDSGLQLRVAFVELTAWINSLAKYRDKVDAAIKAGA